MSKVNYPHILSRLCAPLAIEERAFQSLLHFLGPRIGLPIEGGILLEVPIERASEEAEPASRNFVDPPANIAVIDVSGPLVRRASGIDALCGMTGYERIENDFMDAITDPSKQAVLMVFDSPGGEVGGLFDLADLIYGQRGTKPVYAAVAESAFSAAMALASACERIFLTRTAGVGSIGVFTMHVDQSEFDKQVGVKVTYIYAGEKKVDGNPHEALSDEARGTIQTEVDRTYDLFVKTVARNRGLAEKKVRGTKAGLFFGEDALTAGLADEVGTVSEALASLTSVISGKAPTGTVVAATTPAALAANSERMDPQMEPNNLQTGAAVAAGAPKPKDKKTDDEETKKDGADEAKPPKDEDEEEECKAADPKEVIFLCKVAKRIDLATTFIERGLTLKQVRERLLTDQQQEQQAGGPIGNHVSMTGPNPVDQLDSLAKARAAAKGISYSAAYAEVMRENPKLYTNYLVRGRFIQPEAVAN